MALEERIPSLAYVPIIGILRSCPPERVVEVATLAREYGLTTLEITLDSAEALHQIEAVKSTLPDLTVGAGTVLTPSDVDAAIAAGAAFVVTPVVSSDVIARCVAAGVPSIPGASTPTEIWQAHKAGATAVKLFPASALGGPAYVAAVLQPLGFVDLVPTGGVGAKDVRGYLDVGAAAVALGGSLFPSGLIAEGDMARLADLVTEAVKATQ